MIHKQFSLKVSRRTFLGTTAVAAAGITVIPSHAVAGLGHIAPSDRVVLGFIGCGRQSLSDFAAFSSVAGVQVAACCDVDGMKQQRFKKRVEAWQEKNGVASRCDMYEQYEELLERKDIDAVEVVTPDHWHALQTIHACQAGKDVYVQKPLSFTIKEGLTMVKVARTSKKVVQVGSQQRSSGEFRKAIELVQTGAIGHIEKIYASVGTPPVPFVLPEEIVPGHLNWNLWLGPLNDSNIHYHPNLCPPISLDPEEREKLWGAWRRYRETGNGYTADWGAHMFDIAQAAIGMDGSGPAEIIPKGYKDQEHLTFKYLSGVVMTEQAFLDDSKNAKGIKFIGTKGWIEVARNYLACSDPSLVPENLAGRRPGPMTPEERRKMNQERQKRTEKGNTPYEISAPHMQNFVDSVRSRKDPIAPIEVGCSTGTMCCLGNIASELGRPVIWNPATLSFGDDKEAASHRLYNYQYRRPYSL
jgi:predicted dehydrogenase